jgi:hypothetical protein
MTKKRPCIQSGFAKKRAQTHKKTIFGKHPIFRFYKKHNLASKLFLFDKKNQVEFSLNLCSGNQSVIAGVCIFDMIAASLNSLTAIGFRESQLIYKLCWHVVLP